MIEVCSKHSGTILVPVPGKDAKKIEFIPRGPVNVAEVDDDVAEVLLGQIGGAEYFKAGAIDITGAVEVDTPDSDPIADTELTVAALLALSVAKIGEAVADSADRDFLMNAIAAETQSQNRASAVKVLTERLTALG